MPIDKSKYPPNWKSVSLQIREDAGWCCEWCGVPNGIHIIRKEPEEYRIITIGETAKVVPYQDWLELPEGPGRTRIILTVAHLDRDTTNNERNNLAALCQRCHLNHDRIAQHIPNRRYGRDYAGPQQGKFEI